MTKLTKEQTLLLAGFLALAGTQLASIDHWGDALRPTWVGGFLGQLAIVVRMAFTTPRGSSE